MSGVEFDAALRQRRAKRARRGPHGPNSLDPRGGAKTIVVVEDNNDVLDLAVHYLTARGYRVVAARRGEKALRVLEDAGVRVDLLFRETVMPGEINGLLLAERARGVLPGLRVLLATGYNENVTGRRAAPTAGLAKPPPLDEGGAALPRPRPPSGGDGRPAGLAKADATLLTPQRLPTRLALKTGECQACPSGR